MSQSKRVILCSHGKLRENGELCSVGERQCQSLGVLLRSSNSNVVCILTSTLPGAIQTGEIVRHSGFQDVTFCSDPDLDEERFSQRESHWKLCLRIQRLLARALQFRGDVVLVTRPGWISACFRLLGVVSANAPFTPVDLASSHELVIPCHRGGYGPQWFSESPLDYAFKLKDEIPRNIAIVSRHWRDLPSRRFGESRVVLQTPDWIVRTDVWNMEKLKGVHLFENGCEPLMAISKHQPKPLACMRDLRHEHLESLITIDTHYPDSRWVKFILYPPWAWQLHIHIHAIGHERVLPCRNVHLLKYVISMVQNDSMQHCRMLIFGF